MYTIVTDTLSMAGFDCAVDVDGQPIDDPTRVTVTVYAHEEIDTFVYI